MFFMADEEQTEIARMREALRFTLTEMAKRLGVPESRYKNWEYGRAKTPKDAIAKAWALMATDQPPGVSAPKGAYSDTKVPVPYIGRVAASSSADWSDPLEADLTEPVPVHMLEGKGTFCCVVEGDSMMPMLQPEDLAVFRSAEYARVGVIVLYRHHNGQVTIKQLKHDGTRPILRALNSAYKDEPANGKVAGILVGFVRKIGRRKITDYDPEGLRPDFF